MNYFCTSRKHTRQSPLAHCLLLAILFAQIATIDARAEFSVELQTSQSSYVLGQRVELTLTAFNDSNQDITLSFPSSFQATYILDDVPPLIVREGFFSKALVPARGSHNWDFAVTGIDIGPHEVIGYIAPHTGSGTRNGLETAPSFFEVTAPEPIVDDVFIDFESYPDGTPTRGPNGTNGIWQDAYAQWGVRLSTSGDPTSSRGINLDDNFASDNTILHTTHSRKNIKAEFDMPVFEVSATVGSAQGRTVIMTIFDTDGKIIDSIESIPVANYPALVDPIKLTSNIPIGSVEWAASDPLASVRIDDILLDVRLVPEPNSLALLLASVAILSLGHRLKNYR